MKTLPTLTALALLTPTVAFAEPIMHTVGGDPLGYTEQAACFRFEYREEYVPGTRKNPGYVKSYTDKVEVPCRRPRRHGPYRPSGHHGHIEQSTGPVDDNSCIEGTILGGLAGGALGGVLATEENWIWSIPTGIIGGAMTGCQIDGG